MKAGWFVDGAFRGELSLPGTEPAHATELLDTYKPDKTILASVIHHAGEWETLLASRSRFHRLGADSKLNYRMATRHPEQIGTDRLALAAAAVALYPGKNTLVIGLGTCITYNFINQDACFLGGAISPGMNMRFRAMHEQTALLPLEKEHWNVPLIGYDTSTNLRSGVIHGILGEINHFTEEYRKRYHRFNVVLTGGHAPYFAGQLKNGIFADIFLLYKGLYALSEINL